MAKTGGFLLIFSLGLVTLLTGLTVAGLTQSMNELNTTERSLALHQAFHLAEAGLDLKLTQLAANDTDSVPETPLQDGSYAVAMTDLGGGLWQVRSTGEADGIQQTVTTVVNQPLLGSFPGLFAGEYLATYGGSSRIDAYDSDNGPYTLFPDTTNRTQIHNLTTNSTDPGTVALSGLVDGDVVVGPLAEAADPDDYDPEDVVDGCCVTGTITAADTSYTPPPIEVPSVPTCAGGSNPLDVLSGTLEMSVTDFNAGCFSRLRVGGVGSPATLTLTGDGEINLADPADSDFIVWAWSTIKLNGDITVVARDAFFNNGAKLKVEGPHRVKMYVVGEPGVTYNFTNSAIGIEELSEINAGGEPTKFALYYTPPSRIYMYSPGSGGSFSGLLYAPDAQVRIQKYREFYGAVVAQEVHIAKFVGFHADEALGRACADLLPDPSGCSVPGPPGSPHLLLWRQP